MRKIHWCHAALLGLCVACSHNGRMIAASQAVCPILEKSAPSARPIAAPSNASPAEPLRLAVERTYEGKRANGTVRLRDPLPAYMTPASHLKLAGARAWLVLGEQRLAEEDGQGAVACAQAGLDELGPAYASRRAMDHTGMKLSIAKDDIRHFDYRHAAVIMLRQLTIRMNYYVDLHEDEIAE